MVGAAGEHRLAHRVGVDEGVVLVQEADQQPSGLGHPAGVGRHLAAHHLEQRGLAVAVAADDADPLARGDAERDVGQQRAHAVRLRHPLEVEEVRHQSPRSVIEHGGAGDRAVGHEDDGEVVVLQPVREGAGVVTGLAQEQHRRS